MGVLPAALEPVALAVHLQDVDVVSEPVQQRSGEAGPFYSPALAGGGGNDLQVGDLEARDSLAWLADYLGSGAEAARYLGVDRAW